MTFTQRILARHAGLDNVSAGDLLVASLDTVMGNDITVPPALNRFNAAFPDGRVNQSSRIIFCMDHFTPCKDIKSAENVKQCRDFARKHPEISFFDVGTTGIEHCFLPEQGFVHPGDAVIGADSHTCTYGALGAFSTGVGSTDLAAGIRSGQCWFKVPAGIGFRLSGRLPETSSGKDLILYIIGMIGVDGALYKSIEFFGEGVESLSMDDRFTVCNMAIEAGAKCGIFPVDAKTRAYLDGTRGKLADRSEGTHPVPAFRADEIDSIFEVDESSYEQIIDIDLSSLTPMVALPHKPSNVSPVCELKEEIKVDQVVLGSCTNGRLSDLKAAAEVLKGRKIAPYMRCIVLPGTPEIYLEALKAGYIETFINAGCAVSTPTCGPCLGGHTGVIAGDEVCVSTTNRNFYGRMGHISSKVVLASPRTAAICALTGVLSAESFARAESELKGRG